MESLSGLLPIVIIIAAFYFLFSRPSQARKRVQQQMQTEMWMYPAASGTARAEVMKFAPEPTAFDTPGEQDIAAKDGQWVARWTKVVLK